MDDNMLQGMLLLPDGGEDRDHLKVEDPALEMGVFPQVVDGNDAYRLQRRRGDIL